MDPGGIFAAVTEQAVGIYGAARGAYAVATAVATEPEFWVLSGQLILDGVAMSEIPGVSQAAGAGSVAVDVVRGDAASALLGTAGMVPGAGVAADAAPGGPAVGAVGRDCARGQTGPGLQFRGRHRGGHAWGLEADRGIAAGDWVLARDPETGKLEPKRVTFAYSSIHEDVLILTVEQADGDEELIVTTSEHPFYVEGRGWVPAGGLTVDDGLVGLTGEALGIGSIEFVAGARTAYNFEVADYHTTASATARFGCIIHAVNFPRSSAFTATRH